MNRLISHLHRAPLHRVFTAFLVSVTLWFSAAIGLWGETLPAQAATSTAETSTDPSAPSKAQSAPKEAANSEGGLIDNIREKLNLDEPLPESTKLFFKQVQGEDVEVEEPRPSGKGNNPMQ